MTRRQRLTPLIRITLAAILNMALYLILSNVWRAILNDTESSTVQMLLYNIIVPLMTCAGFALCLCFLTHIRRGRGEDRLFADYENRTYPGIKEDLRTALAHERVYLVLIAVIIAACTFLRAVDHLLLEPGEKLFTHITFPYMTMDLFAASFPITALGELLSAVLDAAFYLLFVLLYRRAAWRKWKAEGKGGGRA